MPDPEEAESLVILFLSLDILALYVVPLGLALKPLGTDQTFGTFLGKVEFAFGAVSLLVVPLLLLLGLSEEIGERFYGHVGRLAFAYVAFAPLVCSWLASVAGALVPLFWEMVAFWVILVAWMAVVAERATHLEQRILSA